jgi:hypothetical protein
LTAKMSNRSVILVSSLTILMAAIPSSILNRMGGL